MFVAITDTRSYKRDIYEATVLRGIQKNADTCVSVSRLHERSSGAAYTSARSPLRIFLLRCDHVNPVPLFIEGIPLTFLDRRII